MFATTSQIILLIFVLLFRQIKLSKMRGYMQFPIMFLAFPCCDVLAKYMEGYIKTNDNWAFLARFCFLSGEGQFEYYIEYNEDQGSPNLLLYYDTADQWPAVYKTSKSCSEKESVLKIEQNQIVNLTISRGELYREMSGCSILPATTTTVVPTITTTKQSKINPITTTEISTTQALSSTSKYTHSTNIPTTDINITSNITDAYEETTIQAGFATSTVSLNIINKTGIGTIRPTIIKRAIPTKPLKIEGVKKSRTIVCNNARRFRSSRERWWFVAVSNCNGRKGIDIKYKILMTNGPSGDYWHEQFSADEFYVMPILMAFSIAYSLLLLGIVICSIELKSRQLLHTTYKLYCFSVFVQFFGILLTSVAYLKYAINGVGSPNMKTCGGMLMGSSETCFLLLLLLLAKGYTITRGRLKLSTSVKITVFMCLYSITYISLFIYEAKVFDPGEVLYLYESPAGYGLIVLRVFAWCIFIYSTVFTLKKYPEKNNFYYPFNICGTFWFIAGPAFILSANSYIDKWIRESVVCAVLLFITFGGHLMFLLLTMPSVANKNFPYHVRTTQIGVMELTGNQNGIEHFNHHVYEPSRALEQTVIIPLTRRTEEIFGGIYSQHLYGASFQRPPPQTIEESRHIQRDTTMDNVLSWSMAKNISTIELPPQCEEAFSPNPTMDSPDFQRKSTVSQQTNGESSRVETPKASVEEWVKEVPVELFSINRTLVADKKEVPAEEKKEEPREETAPNLGENSKTE